MIFHRGVWGKLEQFVRVACQSVEFRSIYSNHFMRQNSLLCDWPQFWVACENAHKSQVGRVSIGVVFARVTIFWSVISAASENATSLSRKKYMTTLIQWVILDWNLWLAQPLHGWNSLEHFNQLVRKYFACTTHILFSFGAEMIDMNGDWLAFVVDTISNRIQEMLIECGENRYVCFRQWNLDCAFSVHNI